VDRSLPLAAALLCVVVFNMGGCDGIISGEFLLADPAYDLIGPQFNDIPPLDRRCDGPDPRVERIEFELVEQSGTTAGTVLVRGVVTNHGLGDWVSGVQQQSARLYVDGVEQASVNFPTLASGESVEVEVEVSFANEFIPSQVTVLITYDPDILLDASEDNDDCNYGNNEAFTDFADGVSEWFDV
jgi:hypothetical protein